MHTHAHAQAHKPLFTQLQRKTTSEQKTKKKNTTLMTASCHSLSHLVSAVEANKSPLLLFFDSFHYSLSFIPLLFPSFCILRGGWANLYMGSSLNRLLSCSFFPGSDCVSCMVPLMKALSASGTGCLSSSLLAFRAAILVPSRQVCHGDL